MSEPIKLVAFCGSLRKGSFNRMALQVFIERAPVGTTVETIEIGDWPLYDADLQALLSVDAEGWKDVGKGPGSTAGNFISWLTIKDLAGSVVEDVERIRKHPLVPANIPIYGYIYDVKSGQLIEVPAATAAGTP